MSDANIETITHGLEPIALIIRADYDEPGIQFFTPGSFSQQVAYMKHPKGHKITAHVHNMMTRHKMGDRFQICPPRKSSLSGAAR